MIERLTRARYAGAGYSVVVVVVYHVLNHNTELVLLVTVLEWLLPDITLN